MGFFSPKLKIFELKIYRWVLCHDNEEWCKNWYEEFDEFWSEHSKISKICALLSCLWPKHIMFKLKKYRGVMFDGTEDWCKIWRKIDSGFNTSNLEKFHQSTWKSQNWDLDGIFSSKVRKCMSLQCTGELFVMAMKNDAKMEEELTCHFKIGMSTLMNFDPSTWKSRTFAL